MEVGNTKKDVEVVSSGEALRMAASWIEGIQPDMLTNYPEVNKEGVRQATQFAGLGFSERKTKESDIWKVDKRLTKKTKQTKKRAELLCIEAVNPVDDIDNSVLEGKSESISKRIVNKKSDLLLPRRKKR
eukprot:jgi/Picsp_1/5986/NSC_03341-R1_---NA---